MLLTNVAITSEHSFPWLWPAEQGYENAQANVAHLLDRKTSVISVSSIPLVSSPVLKSYQSKLLDNPTLALAYYTRSAKQTNADSLVKMGDYYLSGYSATSAPSSQPSSAELANVDKATTCYTSAAEGYRSAQALWNLGWMHENGVGSVTQDFHMAKRYYDLAYELNKEAYLPVKMALVKLRLRSWWNGVSGGKINGIKDEEGDDGRPKTFMEWLYKFLDAAEEMDAAEAAQMAQQNGDELDVLYNEPGMPGGDAEYAARERERNADRYEGEWDDFDDGLVESLIIISLAGALAALVYARQQAQRRREEEARRGVGQVQVQHVPPAGAQQPPAQQPQQPPPPQDQGQEQDRGLFPRPGDPDFNNWVAGGIGH
jgi:SEL1 protein